MAHVSRTALVAALVGVFVPFALSQAKADMIVLKAVDSDTIPTNAPDLWADNVIRAGTNSEIHERLVGFMKFNLSLLPACADIHSITLTTYHLETHNAPQVRIWRSANDSWTRGTNNTYPGLNEVLTPIHNNFPTSEGAAYTWELDAAAVNWSEDLNDHTLTLAMFNEKDGFNYTYWYGSDDPATAPELTIEFTSCFTVVPAPSGLILALLGGAAALCLRGRFNMKAFQHEAV